MPLAKEKGLEADARWQLIQRIVASPSFQKSTRIRDLLYYVTERSLHGQIQDLSEHSIGCAVFGKQPNYSVTEDSSVRVHVRQLRLKLHEFFDSEGRSESIVAEVPKGAYTIVFRPASPNNISAIVPAGIFAKFHFGSRLLPWTIAFLGLFIAGATWFATRPAVPTWPLNFLYTGQQPVRIVVADINYGILRIVNEKNNSLAQYLASSYSQQYSASTTTPREVRLTRYLTGSLLTSYADLVVVDTISRLSNSKRERLAICAARELRPRDLEDGNYVLVGSSSSNPWVGYFQDRLNFQEREDIIGESPKYFQNLHPRAGEQTSYHGLAFTGTAGEDYATISFLPSSSGRGNVLILQGLQQEGTESAGLFLANTENLQHLRKALGIHDTPKRPVYFEALIRTNAVAGAPNMTSIVAVRTIASQ